MGSGSIVSKSLVLQPGVVVAGRYRLVAPLGSGGMGDVFRAVQEPLGREVALKVIRSENQTAELNDRFYAEVRAMAAVKHPGVATVFDFGATEDGTLFYAMELCPGSNLRQLLERDGAMSWPRVHSIALQVASALAAIHAVGIIHRDLKPANIMIADGRVTIVDFGLALQDRLGLDRLTQMGSVLGTPAYVSPEQAQGRAELDARTDLYSFGAVMYEMLCGEPPFQAPTAMALLFRQVSDPVQPLRERLGAAIPPAADALVCRLLEKDPAARPANGRALLALLSGMAPVEDAGPPPPQPEGPPRRDSATQLHMPAAPAPSTRTRSTASGSGSRPTIAVLPFTTRSSEDAEFAEGLAEDVITDLSKLSELVVIDSRSSFAFKEQPPEAQRLANQLGVRYVVTGNLRRSGPRVRLTVNLVDAQTNTSLWSERFDRQIEDVFDVQDELTEHIVAALDVKLHAGEQARLWRRSIRTARGREAFYHGLASFRVLSRANLLDALASFSRLIELEPDSPLGHAHAAQCHWFLAWLDGLESLDQHLAEARGMVARALERDPECAIAHSVLAHVHILDRKHDEALAAGRRSAELQPNSADVLANFGEVLVILGRDDEALGVMTRALRSSPAGAPFYVQMLAAAYRGLGRFHDAIAVLRDAVARYPDHAILRFTLITNLGAAGLASEAQEQARVLRRLDPRFDMRAMALRIPFARKSQNEALLSYLERGGVLDSKPSLES